MKRYGSGWYERVLMLGMAMVSLVAVSCGGAGADLDGLDVPEDVVGRIVYFRAEDCEPCEAVYTTVIAPLEERCGTSLEVKLVDVASPEGYEAFVATETALIGEAGRWDVPAIVVGDTFYVGENAIEQELVPYLQCVFGAGGNDWPDVKSLQDIAPSASIPQTQDDGSFASGDAAGVESCLTDETSAVCASPEPLFALYVTQADCTDNCDRTRYDLRYLRGVYPQLAFEERELSGNEALVAAVGDALGIPAAERSVPPLVVVGDDYLAGDAVTLEALEALLAKYAEGGASAFWYTLDIGEE